MDTDSLHFGLSCDSVEEAVRPEGLQKRMIPLVHMKWERAGNFQTRVRRQAQHRSV